MKKTKRSTQKGRRNMFLLAVLFFLSGSSLFAQTAKKGSGMKDMNAVSEISLKDHLKQQWINAHPKEYIQQGGVIPATDKAAVIQNNRNADDGAAPRRELFYPLPHIKGFPAYVNTGNQLADQEYYRICKDKWITENQELYSSLNSSQIPTEINQSK